MIKNIEELDQVIDFAWELSRNKLHASYPRRTSIDKLKEEIEKAIKSEKFNIIGYYHENVLCGLCSYFWISNEKYAQTTVFLINEDYEEIADKFINYINRELPGYELFIGLPSTNKIANEYFIEKNIECIEDSIVTRICNLEPHANKGYSSIEEINKNNFEEYALFHDKYAIPQGIYFNSENLYEDIEYFRVFAFRHDGEIHASVFVKADKDISDAFGLFIDEEYKNKGIESILTNEILAHLYNEFGSIKEILYFIDRDCPDELNMALTLGFEIKEEYRCYKYILNES